MSASKWKPYPNYKDSDTFAKRIPIHWNELALKRVSSINDDTLPEDTNPMREMCYVDIGSVSYQDGITECEEMVFEESPSRARRLANDGDVIVSTVRTYLKAICKINNSKNEMVFSTGFAVVRPDNSWKKDSIGDFIVADYFVENVVANSDGVSYPAINASDLGCLKIIQPPKDEQARIKQFLKTRDSRINSSISSLNSQIRLLEEKRSSLITQAVTIGLNTDVSMRETSVDWLSEIPVHWQDGIVKRFYKVDLGKMLDSKKQTGDSKPYLRAANIHWDGIKLDSVNQMGFTKKQQSHYRLKKGDLLVTEGGHTVGRSAIWDEDFECYFQNSLNRVRGKSSSEEKYLHYIMFHLKLSGYTNVISDTATFAHLTKEKLEVLTIPMPPVEEQKRIISYLDDLCKKVDSSKLILEGQIASLKEYQTALISAAVTGKIDVRGR